MLSMNAYGTKTARRSAADGSFNLLFSSSKEFSFLLNGAAICQARNSINVI